MALHNLKITVIDGGKADTTALGGGSTDSGGGEKQPNGKDSLLYKVLNYNTTIKSKVRQSVSPTTFFAIQSGVNLARQVGREFINYYVSDIGRANGDSNYQAIVNRKIEQVTDVLSVGQGMLSGAAAGATAGSAGGIWGVAIGAVIGAVVGAASSSVGIGFKYAERERAYQHELFKENTSQAYQLARANYSAYTGRVR